ncbi:MAG: ATP-grasp domain-containing protein [Gemmatimonadaceae bacterium]
MSQDTWNGAADRGGYRLALATCAAEPHLTVDDRLLVAPLAARGVTATAAVWSDADVAWSDFDGVIVRSCWDYHLRSREFGRWIDALEATGVPLWNPPNVLRWNAEKSYLRDLAARGVDVVPTRWVEQGATESLASVLAGTGWARAVVKPAVSAAAHDTWRTSPDEAAAREDEFQALVAVGRVLVQPYLDSIEREGEWSFVFLGGAFSHAVVKRPKMGDFRVQACHGGEERAAAAPPTLIAAAEAVVRAGAADCLYARVDGCVVDGRLLLMELELLEPSLFLAGHPAAADRLADALVDVLGASRAGVGASPALPARPAEVRR